MTLTSKSIQQTQQIAADIAKQVLKGQKPKLLLLTGELGMGKTSFSQGFGAGLGITQAITSPTFNIIKNYPLPNSLQKLYHLDLYRLDQEWELIELELDKILQNPQIISLVEWAEKFPKVWQSTPHLSISFKATGPDNNRLINIQD